MGRPAKAQSETVVDFKAPVRPARVNSGKFDIHGSGQKYREWYYEAPEGESFEAMLDPGYWSHIAARLGRRDRIVIEPEGLSYSAVLIVTACDNTSAHVRILSSVNLTDAKEDDRENDKYLVEYVAHDNWRVLRKADRVVVRKDFPTVESAIDEMNKL